MGIAGARDVAREEEFGATVHSPTPRGRLAPRLPGRIPSLDGLRAISITMVLFGHLAATEDMPRVMHHLHHLGNFGVKVFFVISGFLISSILIKEFETAGRINLKNFYLRRTFRILPAFYAYFLVIVALDMAGYLSLYPGDALHAATFTMNYHHVRAWYLNHTWSLSVEEQFYLLWPALLLLLGVKRALGVAAAAIFLSPAARLFMLLRLSPSSSALTREFQAVADALATGCLLAGAYNWLGGRDRYLAFLKSPWFLIVPVFGFLVPVGLFAVKPGLYYVLGQSVANVAIALCVDRSVRLPCDLFGRLINTRPFVFVGVLSYSLYLWQEPFLNPFSSSKAASFPYNIPLAIAAAVASYYLVEKPFLKLRSSFHS